MYVKEGDKVLQQQQQRKEGGKHFHLFNRQRERALSCQFLESLQLACAYTIPMGLHRKHNHEPVVLHEIVYSTDLQKSEKLKIVLMVDES